MILRFSIFLIFLMSCSAETEEYFPPLIRHESASIFALTNKVTSREKGYNTSEDTSFTFTSILHINSVWHNDKDQLLEVFLTENRVSTISKDGKFKQQDIVKIPDRPFYITQIGNIPSDIVAHTYKDQWLLNLERGIASLLQLQYRVGPTVETDISGLCNVFYNAQSVHYIEKRKKDCSNWDLRMAYRGEPALSVSKRSVENLVFEMYPEGSLKKVSSHEVHKLYIAAQPDVGSIVESSFVLEHVHTKSEEPEQMDEYESLEQAVHSLLEWYREFSIEADVDDEVSKIKGGNIRHQVKTHAKNLKDNLVGQDVLAQTFAKLMRVARFAETEDLKAALVKNKDIQMQLVDLYGATQTIEAHKAINETFSYKQRSDADILEKYLQSLAVATHPDVEIVEDLFALVQTIDDEPQNLKIKESVTQCMASLATHFLGKAIQIDIREYLVQELKKECGKDKDCKVRMIRALQNMQDPKTIDVLIGYAFRANDKLSVAAMHALRRFPVMHFRESHRLVFNYIFYQIRKPYDTSARMLAFDILLDLRPNKRDMSQMVEFLASNDRHFEVKTYVIQKLKMYGEKYPKFKSFIQGCINEKSHVNNYHALAQKGFTSVLSRDLSRAPAFNETLVSVQEVYKGVLKRGSVELIINADNHETSAFKLGIFTNGLESFVSNTNDNEVEDEEEEEEDEKDYSPITAGMEISVQGIQHRPLIFFTGKAELMTHIWSGTVSESTPAFQATMLVHDHEQYVILSSGVTVFFNVFGTKTLDLNGKASFSLWNRNAQTEIKQNSATAVYSVMKAGFTYATLENDIMYSYDPKIVLQAHIDFYDEMKLCMRLQRPEMLLNHKSTKSISLHSTHQYTKKVNLKTSYKFPAQTFALNQKNNDMCRTVSKDLQH